MPIFVSNGCCDSGPKHRTRSVQQIIFEGLSSSAKGRQISQQSRRSGNFHVLYAVGCLNRSNFSPALALSIFDSAESAIRMLSIYPIDSSWGLALLQEAVSSHAYTSNLLRYCTGQGDLADGADHFAIVQSEQEEGTWISGIQAHIADIAAVEESRAALRGSDALASYATTVWEQFGFLHPRLLESVPLGVRLQDHASGADFILSLYHELIHVGALYGMLGTAASAIRSLIFQLEANLITRRRQSGRQ